MNALILGGNGFIGSHLVDYLLQSGIRVKVFDRAMEKFREPLPDVEYVLGNFSDRNLIRKALSGIDVVYHLISTTVPGTSNQYPSMDVESNLINTIKLLEDCVKSNVKKVVYLSSGGAVYGEPETIPLNEMHSTNPESSYGITKLAIEKYIDLFHRLHGLDYVILRPSNPYGSRQNPFGVQGAIAVFLGKVLMDKEIYIWGDGSIVRDYIFIDDLIAGIYNASVSKTSEGIYNLGSGEGYSLNQILSYIKNITQKEIDVRYQPGRLFDPPQVVLDISKAVEDLGWKPAIQIEDGIKALWDYIRHLSLHL